MKEDYGYSRPPKNFLLIVIFYFIIFFVALFVGKGLTVWSIKATFGLVLGLFIIFFITFKYEYGVVFIIFSILLMKIIPYQIMPIRIVNLFNISFFTTLFSFILQDKILERKKHPSTPFNLPLILFIFVLLIGVSRFDFSNMTTSEVAWAYVYGFLRPVQVYSIFFLVYYGLLKEKKVINLYLFSIIIICICFSIYGLYTHYSLLPSDLPDGVFARAFSEIFENPNQLGNFLLQLSMIPLALMFINTLKSYRAVFIVIWIITLIAIIFTYSRGAYLALVISLISFFSIAKRRIMPLLVFVGVVVILFLPISVKERVKMTLEESQEGSLQLEGSAGRRTLIWKGTLKYFQEKPLRIIIGGGFSDYEMHYSEESSFTQKPRDLHNYHLLLLCNYGLIGYIIFWWLIITSLNMSWFVYKQSDDEFYKMLAIASISLIIGISITNMFSNLFHDFNSFMFWVLTGIIAWKREEMISKKLTA